jgi:hypothetical protein
MFARRELSRRDAGIGIAARPRSRRNFKGFVRTGTVRPEAGIARALRLSAAIKLPLSAICNEPTATLDLALVKQRLSAA